MVQMSAPGQCCCGRRYRSRCEHRVLLPPRHRSAPSPRSRERESRAPRPADALHPAAQHVKREKPWQGAARSHCPSAWARLLPVGRHHHPQQLQAAALLQQRRSPPHDPLAATPRRATPDLEGRALATLQGAVTTGVRDALLLVDAPAP